MKDKPSYDELVHQVQCLEEKLGHCSGIRDTEARFRTFYEQIPMAYQSLDSEGCLVEVNPAWLRTLGYTRDEVVGKPFSEFLPGEWQAHFNALFPELKSVGEILGQEFSLVRKNGDTILVSFTGRVDCDARGGFKQTHCVFQNITERKQTEDAFRSEKAFTETALNAIQDTFVLFDPKTGTVIRWNHAFTRVTGFSDEEIPGISVIDTCIDPEHRDRVLDFISSVLEKGGGTIEVDLVCKNGSHIPMEFSASMVRDDRNRPKYIIAIGRDISERKEAEQALMDSHQRFLTVLDSIDATVYVVDMDTYEVLFMNQYMKRHFGKDMTGETCYQAYRRASGVCAHCPNPGLLDKSGNPTGVNVWQTEHPVNGKWYMNHDRAIKWTDGRMVKLQIATDITDLKQMEEELRQAHKMESIGTLAGGVAHDFNNILGIIIGNTELALDDTPEWSPVCGHLKEIQDAGLRAKDVVRQLLGFTRKGKAEKKPLDLSRIVRESMPLIRSSVPSTIAIDENLPKSGASIMADATQIHQVMINLCTNAAHAMWENGGIIRIRMEEFRVDAGSEYAIAGMKPGPHLMLSVSDTGAGIDPEIRDKIFDPYFTTKEVGKGTGMGLSVVHGIVKSHNAHIRVESEPGEGACFSLFFPVVHAGPPPAGTEDKRPERAKGFAAHILLVDDEVSITAIMARTLERLGFSVETENCPEKALGIFNRDPRRFDLVISDYTMPGMNGIMLTEKMKAVRPDIPVIVCTGHSAHVDERAASRAGVAAYMMKPVSRLSIAETIDRVMDNR
ncbi:MAG: PAS domain S-box protein [Desulfobacter sp.]